MPFLNLPNMGIRDPRVPVEPDAHLPQPNKYHRPGTAGTEAALKFNRHQASEKLRQATRVERAYKTKKRSAAARANYLEAKAHFHQAGKDFKIGVSLAVSVVKSVPYLLNEKRERRRFKACEAIQRREMEERRQQDEKLAKERAALRPARGSSQLHVGGDGFI